MTDEQVLEVSEFMFAGGFVGAFSWHAYNEPLMAWPRLKNLMFTIRARGHHTPFLLWTNGDLLTPEIAAEFDTIIVTNYAKRNLAPFREVCKDVRSVGPGLDWRLNPPQVEPTREPRCVRPHLEIVLDYYGNVRTCCMDWQGRTSVGNIHDTPFSELWERWVKLRACLSVEPMGDDAPQRCLRCGTRYTQLADYSHEACERIRGHLKI